MTNEEKGILNQLRTKVRSRPQKCYNPDCSNDSIRSHIQQVEGPIREISPSGRIVQLEEIDPHFSNRKYRFKEKGISQQGDVLTFWGFCNSCDSKLFREIERDDIDFKLYRTQLLYSYRGYLSEFYKQEYNLKHYLEIFNSNKLSVAVKERYRPLDLQYRLIVKSGQSTKKLLEHDIKHGTQNFEFIHFTIPRIEVCTSTAYALPVAIRVNEEFVADIESRDSFSFGNTPIFINLVPKEKFLNVILGCHKDKTLKGRLDLEKIQKYNCHDKVKLISDILIRHIETWFVSLNLYNIWKQRNMDNEILRQIEIYLSPLMKTKHVKFNMFRDIV